MLSFLAGTWLWSRLAVLAFPFVLADVTQSLDNIGVFIVGIGAAAAFVSYCIAGLLLMFPGEYGERRGAGMALLQRTSMGVLVLGSAFFLAHVLLLGVPGINGGHPLIQQLTPS